MNYQIKEGCVGRRPYVMVFRAYKPQKISGDSVIVFVGGGGHRMKVWEETPDGRQGWAPLFAEKGREVIILEWACNSPEVYQCSKKELCSLTQKENMDLILRVITQEIPQDRMVVFLGWSMGGPQVLKMAADVLPKGKVASVMGYAATGPLNFFSPKTYPELSLEEPFHISNAALDRISDSPLFPKKHAENYRREYVCPVSPRMVLIHSKHPLFREQWGLLTIKNPKKIPPVLLVNGSRDKGHEPAREKVFIDWLRKYQPDITSRYIKEFPHLGMLCRGNERIVKIYLTWLNERLL